MLVGDLWNDEKGFEVQYGLLNGKHLLVDGVHKHSDLFVMHGL